MVNYENVAGLIVELLQTQHSTEAVKNGFCACGLYQWNANNIDFSRIISTCDRPRVRSEESLLYHEDISGATYDENCPPNEQDVQRAFVPNNAVHPCPSDLDHNANRISHFTVTFDQFNEVILPVPPVPVRNESIEEVEDTFVPEYDTPDHHDLEVFSRYAIHPGASELTNRATIFFGQFNEVIQPNQPVPVLLQFVENALVPEHNASVS